MTQREPSPDASRLSTLAHGDLTIEGRLVAASNATLRGLAHGADGSVTCVIKPVAGERPLWDFPEGTLTGREIAAYELSEALGWHLVPTTLWREDTLVGPAMVQEWIVEVDEQRPVGIWPIADVPGPWAVIVEGNDGAGDAVALAHDRRSDLQQLAIFDAICNNADRKGGHVLADASGRLWGIDHGVTFSDEDKLRTVLWGWAGETIPAELVSDVASLAERLDAGLPGVETWLTESEIEALQRRVSDLLATGVFPLPSADWPAIPWPIM